MEKRTPNYRAELVPLAFDIVTTGTQLVGSAIIDYEKHIAATVESKKFQDALKTAIHNHRKKMFLNALKGKHCSTEEAKKEELDALLKAGHKVAFL